MGSKRKRKMKDEAPADNSTLGDGGRGRGGVTDERFLSANFDPKFQKVPKQKSKVQIDDRFQRMFTDASFSSSAAPTDKRGRPKDKAGDSERRLLKHYYRIGDGEEEEEDEEEVEEEVERGGGGVDDVAKAAESSDGDDDDDDNEDDEEEQSSDLEEDSATTDTEDGSGSDEEDEEGDELEESVPTIDEETRRLAVVNLDWRHVRAVDLYVLLSSFLPKNGRILSVTIYPSEFGLQRMKEEELHGPVGLFVDDKSDDDDEDENGDIDNEKLRAYERNRMRYYYAVIECDSSATGDHLYKTCDGDELGRSANVLDLRFIPDSMEFKHPPHDKATEVPENYDAKNFETRALQQSKIHLTWDEDEPDRVRTLRKNFNADQLADLEVKDFLASDDSESDSEDNRGALKDQSDKGKKIDKYRALLQEGNGSDGDGENGNRDMEITFNTGLEDLSKRLMEKKDKKSETVWEAYLRKRREKKKARKNKSENSSDEESSDADRELIEEPDDFFLDEPPVKRSKKEKGHGKTGKSRKEMENAEAEGAASRAELELLLTDDAGADAGPKGYKIKSEQSKRKRGSEDSKIPTGEYNDPRFSALFTHPLYALDPTHPDFKRSAVYARQFADRWQKGDGHKLTKGASKETTVSAELAHKGDDKINKDECRPNSHTSSSTSGKNELTSLVKSVKMKSKLVQLAENGKTSSKRKR